MLGIRTALNWLTVRLLRPRGAELPITEPSPFGIGPAKKPIGCWGFDLFVDENDTLIGADIARSRVYEQHVVKAINRLLPVGGTFLDIGANIGYHSMAAARHVGSTGKVLCIDMNPNNCALLWYSAQRNGYSQVRVFHRAASEKKQLLEFWTRRGTGNSALVSDNIRSKLGNETISEAQQVEACPVDDVVADEPVDLIKMDIEGSELQAVLGMKKLLSRRTKPTIVFEFFPNLLREIGRIQPTVLLDELRGFGYSLHALPDNGVVLPEQLSNDGASQLAKTRHLVDLVALPLDRSSELRKAS